MGGSGDISTFELLEYNCIIRNLWSGNHGSIATILIHINTAKPESMKDVSDGDEH